MALVSAPAGTARRRRWRRGRPSTAPAGLVVVRSVRRRADAVHVLPAVGDLGDVAGSGRRRVRAARPGRRRHLRRGVAVANELATVDEPGVIVVDDLHLAAPAPATLAAFIDALPDGFRFVAGTRSDPPLSLARLRLRGELLELRGDDLRFDADEMAEFFELQDVTLAGDELLRLHDLTEGWPAGAQLAAIALQRGAGRDDFMEAFATHRSGRRRLPPQRGAGEPAARPRRLPRRDVGARHVRCRAVRRGHRREDAAARPRPPDRRQPVRRRRSTTGPAGTATTTCSARSCGPGWPRSGESRLAGRPRPGVPGARGSAATSPARSATRWPSATSIAPGEILRAAIGPVDEHVRGRRRRGPGGAAVAPRARRGVHRDRPDVGPRVPDRADHARPARGRAVVAGPGPAGPPRRRRRAGRAHRGGVGRAPPAPRRALEAIAPPGPAWTAVDGRPRATAWCRCSTPATARAHIQAGRARPGPARCSTTPARTRSATRSPTTSAIRASPRSSPPRRRPHAADRAGRRASSSADPLGPRPTRAGSDLRRPGARSSSPRA